MTEGRGNVLIHKSRIRSPRPPPNVSRRTRPVSPVRK